MGFTSGLKAGAYLYVARIAYHFYASSSIALTVAILSGDTPIPYSPINKKHASRHPKNFNTPKQRKLDNPLQLLVLCIIMLIDICTICRITMQNVPKTNIKAVPGHV